MNVNLAALLYLVSGVLFIFALRGLSHPTTSRQGNRYGMIGMAIAILTTLVLRPPSGIVRLAAGRLRPADRRRLRRGARAPHRNDQDAAAGRLLPLARRPRRRAGGGGRPVRAAGLRHRRARRHPSRQPDRNVARRGDRRAHLHRLDHRLPEARRPHVGQADHAAAASRHQSGARSRAGPAASRRSSSRAARCCSC